MQNSRQSLTERLADRRSRRLLNDAISRAGAQTTRDELLAVARRSAATS